MVVLVIDTKNKNDHYWSTLYEWNMDVCDNGFQLKISSLVCVKQSMLAGWTLGISLLGTWEIIDQIRKNVLTKFL